MKTCRWELIFTSKLAQVTLSKAKSTKMLSSTFLRYRTTAILFHLIITLWSVTIMITAKITHSIPEAQILEIINWPSKMFRALNRDSRIRIRMQWVRIREHHIRIIQVNARLVIIVSQHQEILKIEFIDNNLNRIQLVKLLCHRENYLLIQWGPIIKIIKRKRCSKSEMVQLLKVMEVQQKSKLFSNLQSTTFLKEKLRVKHFLVTTLAKIINKQHLAKIHNFLIISSS